MTVATVGIRELKTHLSKYIRQVKQGSIVLITERGEPVGQIMPVVKKQSLEKKMLALRDAGLLSWEGEGLPQKLESRNPITKLQSEKTAAELLLEDRI